MMTRLYALAASLLCLSQATVSFAGVVQAEYFVGADPGLGQGTPINVTADTNATAADLSQVSIPLAGLAPGTHNVNVRVKDSAGRWSSPFLRRFTLVSSNFTVPTPALSLTTNNLAAAELFIGSDPGAGAGTAIALTNSGFAADAATIQPIGNTTLPGTYQVGLRFKDAVGRWGNPMVRRVTIQPSALVGSTVSNLPADDVVAPVGQTYLLSFPPVLTSSNTFTLNVGGVATQLTPRPFESLSDFLFRAVQTVGADPGLAPLVAATVVGSNSIRLVAKEHGLKPSSWLTTSSNIITSLEKNGDIGSAGRKIIAAEWFIGVPPTPGNGTSIVLSETNRNEASFSNVTAPITAVRAGWHKVGVRFKNAAGMWGNPVLSGFASYSLFGASDTNPPSIALQGANPLDLPIGVAFAEPGYGASDNVDGNIAERVVVEGTINTNVAGNYTLSYTLADLAGNRTKTNRVVRVVDTNRPTFITASNVVINAPRATPDPFAGLTATDPRSGDITHRIEYTAGNIDWFTPGTYTASYRVANASGNSTNLTRSLTLTRDGVFYPAFARWIKERANGAPESQIVPTADLDRDGIANLAEWAADTDPTNPSHALRLAAARNSGGSNTVSWTAGWRVSYTLDRTTNLLGGWQTLEDGITTSSDATFQYEVSSTGQMNFFRLRARPKLPILDLP